MLLFLSFLSSFLMTLCVDFVADETFLKLFSSESLTSSEHIKPIGIINIDELDNETKSIKGLEGELSNKINSLINPITGLCSLTEEDYTLPGPIPFTIDRAHHELGKTKIGFGGWSILQHMMGFICFADEITPLRVYEAHGDVLAYASKKRNESVYKGPLNVSVNFLPNGIVNSGSGEISAGNNKKNNFITVPSKYELILTESNGTKRIYYPHMPGGYIWPTTAMQKILLKEMILPSGHRVFFKRYFNDLKEPTLDIEITNPKGTKIFSSLKVITSAEQDKNKSLRLIGPDKRCISYNQKLLKDDFYPIDNVEGLRQGNIYYEYLDPPFRIRKKTFANGFCFTNDYSVLTKSAIETRPNPPKKGFKISCPQNAVQFQKAPVGSNGQEVVTHSFYYFKKDGKGGDDGYTEVFDALGNKTIYHFSKHKRVVTIEKFIGNDQLVQSEHMLWEDNKKDANYSNLLARYWKNEKGEISSLRTFQYDRKGNVIEEKLYGNFSGKNTGSIGFNEKSGFLVDGVECCVKYNQYSDNDFNVKLSDIASNGVITKYYYLEGTNLPIKELVYDHGLIKERCFLKYDEDNLLIEKIADDGSSEDINDLKGVSERRILRYHRKQEGVGIGQPYIVEEMYLDLKTKKECLLNRKERVYQSNGQITEEAYFNANSDYLYTLYYTYDHLGRLVEEVNSKSITSKYRYNECSCLIYESSRPDVEKYFEYDLAGRLISSKEVHLDGSEYIIKNRYNSLSQKVSQEDSYGSIENYEWDRFGNLLKIISSEVLNEEGNLVRPIVEKKYDAFGRLIEEIDPKGFKTVIKYNVEDKPIWIAYPDGSEETFEYNTSGNLIRSKSKTGSITEYEYDYRDREIVKTVYNPEGDLLYRTHKIYKGWRLISETDPIGLTTTYEYDGAGRLILKKIKETIWSFAYDSLGQIYRQTIESHNDDYISHIFIRDKFGDVVEEQVVSKKGLKNKILYAYDLFGNKTEITHFTDKPCKTHISYNSLNEPIKIIDPLGNTTTFEYSKTYCDKVSRYLKKNIEKDALGQFTVMLSDTVGRPFSIEKFNQDGQRIAFSEKRYDICSNLALNIDYIFANGKQLKAIQTKKNYGPLHRIEQIIEAFDSEDEKVTRFFYNSQGLLEAKVSPDKSSLHYEYNCLGLMTRMYSQSTHLFESIDYSYSYNKSCLPTVIENRLTAKTTVREYDREGRLLSEILESDYKISYDYDNLGRCSKITFPDKSSIAYTYDGPQIYCIEKFNKSRKLLYKHVYEERDLSGHPIKMITGKVCQQLDWNPLGRLSGIDSGFFHEKVDLFDSVGNILKVSFENQESYFKYNDLYQLVSEEGLINHKYCFDSSNTKIECDSNRFISNFLNQIIDDSKQCYTYDDRGNLIQKGDNYYFYDALDRLIKIVEPDGRTCQYDYDAFDRRISKSYQENDSFFLYLDKEEVGLITSDGKIKQLRVLADLQSFDKAASITIELDDKIYVPICDFRGSLRALVDLENNKVKESYNISAFGEIYYHDSAGQTIEGSLIDNPWIFSFKRQDQETGFILFGRRFYDPDLGAWITKDPGGFDDGFNLYSFVAGNPITNKDLWGLTTLKGNNNLNKTNVLNETKETKPSISQTIINEIRSHAGNFIKRVGHEMPIPYIRLGVKSLGYFIERGSFVPPVGEFLQESSKKATVGTREDKNYIVSFINGIGNTFDDVYATVNKISKENNDILIYLVHNSSHGIILDVLECMANAIGIPTHSQEVVQSYFHELAKYAKETERRVFHLAHSQGGLLTKAGLKDLSPEERSCFDVFSYGSAHIIPKDMAASVYNYVNLLDPVPWIGDWPGMIRALCFSGSHLQIIDHPRKAKLFDHMILGDSYANHWKKNTNKLLGK